MDANSQQSLFTSLLLHEIMRTIRDGKTVTSDNISIAQSPEWAGQYDDGWGWRDLTTEEYETLCNRKPNDITQLGDAANQYSGCDNQTDTVIGFKDGTHYRIWNRSVYDLASRLIAGLDTDVK